MIMNKIHYDVFAGVIDTVGIEDIIFDLMRYEIEKIPPETTVMSGAIGAEFIFGLGKLFTDKEYSEIGEIKNRLRQKFADQYEQDERIKLTIDGFKLRIFCRVLNKGLVYTEVFAGGELMTTKGIGPVVLEGMKKDIEYINGFVLMIDIANRFTGKRIGVKETIVEDLKDHYDLLHRIITHETIHIIQKIYTVGKGEAYFKPRIKDEEQRGFVPYINRLSEIEAYARSVVDELKEMGLDTLEEMREAMPGCWSYKFVKPHISEKNFKVFVNKIYFLMKEYLKEKEVGNG